MTLTAVDVLIEPDARLLERARVANTRLYAEYPGGYAFDATHAPHITLVHRYVQTSQLARFFEAIDGLVADRRPIGAALQATKLSYVSIGDIGIMSIDVARTPALDGLHQAVLDTVAPFARTGGTAAAFFTTPEEPGIIPPTVQYVHDFVPKFSGANYRPHLTVGPGRAPFLEKMKAERFAPLEFAIEGIAVYQLGEFGTARKKLWAAAAR